MNREDDNQTFLNLVVQKVDPSSIQEFMRSWMRQQCKDFKLVFIQKKDASKEEKQAITYACGFASAIGQSELVAVVTSEDEVPKAEITKILKDTSIFPVDKMEVLKMRTEASKQKIEDQKIEKLEEKVEQNIETKNSIWNKREIAEKDDAAKMMLQQKSLDGEVSQKKEAEKTKDAKPVEKVFFKIIVPNYNNMPYIKKCLDSILEQTFQDFKIIVVDDLSTDGSDKFCEMYSRKHLDKIVYKQLATKGYAGAARNVGLDYPIECKYILFVDSDDWLFNHSVLKNIYHQIKTSSKNVKLIKMAMWHFYGENDRKNHIRTFDGSPNRYVSQRNGCGPGRTCISSELSKCKFVENRRIANDVIWHLRCLDAITDENILYINSPCQTYNCISTTSGTNLIKKNRTSAKYINNMKLLLDDLTNEKFKSDVVKQLQQSSIEYAKVFCCANNSPMKTSLNDKNRLDMTVVSVFYDAMINPLRKIATKKAIDYWLKQKNLPKEILFVELGFNGIFTFSQNDFPKQIQYIRINGNDSNKYLFQKEHLWNIAAKKAKYEKLMFVDSDIAPLDNVDWFKKVYDALDRGLFTQGFSQITYLDKNNHPMTFGGKQLSKFSYTSSYVRQHKTSGVPGGVYCLHKTTLKQIGYFNYLPFGGGDDLFWSELLNTDKRFLFILFRREKVTSIFSSIEKQKKTKRIVDVDVKLHHFFHGDRKNRSYEHRHYVLLTQFPIIGNLILDDSSGLAAWKDKNYYFYNIAKHLPEINDDKAIAAKLFDGQIDYATFYSELHQKFADSNWYKSKSDIINFIKQLQEKCQCKKINANFTCRPSADVVISFTTYKNRFLSNDIWSFLNSIITQNVKNIKIHIVCTLFKDDYDSLAPKLKTFFNDHGIEVLVCDTDYKSHKKYLLSMQKYCTLPVITVDDDIVYDGDMVQTLYEDHLKYPNVIIGGRIRKMNFDQNGKLMKYKSWKFTNDQTPSINLCSTTGGGTLFPPSFCQLINANTPNMINKTNTQLQDDFFLHYLAQQNGIKTMCASLGNRIDYSNPRGLERGFMKEILSVANSGESLWKTNIHTNDNLIKIFEK